MTKQLEGKKAPNFKLDSTSLKTFELSKLKNGLIIYFYPKDNTPGCTPEHEKVAYDVGQEIAKSGSVLITGGLGGIMSASSHGAKDANGLTLGIIPQDLSLIHI